MSTKAVKPTIVVDENVIERCSFAVVIPSVGIKSSYVFLNIPVSETPLGRELYDGQHRGWIAVKLSKEGYWKALDATASIRAIGNETHIAITTVEENIECDFVALGVDQRMRREDVDGATIIKKNKSGTKWIFTHAHIEEHHDRLLLAETAIATVFDELTYNTLSRVITLIVNNKPSNQQLGAAAIMEHIRNFKHDCMKLARYFEGELTIGDHVKNRESRYIYQMIQNAFESCEKKWKIEKSAELNAISDYIAPIKKRLASRHSFKYRWEKPTIFPNAQNTQSEE